MSRILKYGLIPENDLGKIKAFGDFMSHSSFSYYNVTVEEKGKFKGKLIFTPMQNKILSQLYPDIKENMESLVTLTYFVFRHFKEENDHLAPLKSFDSMMFKPLMQISFEELRSSSVEFEAIFKNFARLLHVSDQEESYEAKWLKEVSSANLVELIEGNVKIGGQLKEIAPQDKGKSGFIDQSDPYMNDIATSVRMYRNALAHPGFNDIVDQRFIVENNSYDNSSVVIAAKLFFVLVILIVRYRYDDLVKAIDSTIPKGILGPNNGEKALTEEQLEEMARESLNKYYIPALKESQLFYIKDVYKFTGDSTNEDAKQTIIHIKLKMRNDMKEIVDVGEEENQRSSFATDGPDLGNLELLDRSDGRMALLGEAGSGKTTMLAQLALELIRRWQQSGHDSEPKLPVRVNLTNFQVFNNLMNYVRAAVLECSSALFGQEATIVWDYVFGQLKKGNVVLLLDGLNEVKGDFHEAWNKLISFMDEYPECQYILSSRIDDIKLYTNNLELISESGFKLFDVCSLSGEDIQRQLRNTLRVLFGNESLAKSWYDSIKASKSLAEMASNPMQLMLLIRLMKSVEHHSLVSMNPSVLFDSFIYEMLKYEFLKQEKKTDSELRSERAEFDKVLRVIACMMGPMPEVLQVNDVKIAYLESLDFSKVSEKVSRTLLQEFSRLLEKGKRMGLLSNGPNDSQEMISFTHQSWMEFYQSLDIAESLMGIIRNPAILPANEDYLIMDVVNRLIKMHYFARHLKTVYELMEHREAPGFTLKTATVKCKLTIFLLEQGTTGVASATLRKSTETERGLLPDSNSIMPRINSSLLPLSFSTASLRQIALSPQNTDIQNHSLYRLSPQQITESAILNIMHLYRQLHPSGELKTDILKGIFECAAQLGTMKIAEELTTPYWMGTWMSLDDIRQQYGSTGIAIDRRDTRILADILILKFHRPTNLCKKIIQHYLFFVSCNAKNSHNTILGHLLRLYERMDDQQLKEEADKLNAEAKLFGGYLKHQRKLLAHYALYMMKDPDYIVAHYDPSQRINIHRTALNHLFELSDHTGIQELLLRSVANIESMKTDATDIDKNRDTGLRILRYMLFRFPDSEQLNKFLWKKSNAYILERNPELVDILPIDKIPDDFINSHYDIDIFQMMRQEQIESDSRQHILTDYRQEKVSETEGTIRDDMVVIPYETRKQFFVPVTPDEKSKDGNIVRNRIAYAVYGRPNNQSLILLTEGMATGDKFSKKYCRLEGIDQWFVIDSNIPAEGTFAELQFKSMSQSLPYCGTIETPLGDDGKEPIPYVYLIRRDDNFIARVTDSEWVEKLQQTNIVKQLLGRDKTSINHQSIHIQEVALFSHGVPYQSDRTHSSLLRIHAITAESLSNKADVLTDGIPSDGYLSFYETKNTYSGKLPLKVNEFSRGQDSVLRNVAFVGNFRGHGMLVAGAGQYVSIGTYLQLEDNIGYDRVVFVANICRVWELTAEVTTDLPKRGWTRFKDVPIRLVYWIKIRQGNDWTFYIAKLGRDDFDATEYEQSLEVLEIENQEYPVSKVRIKTLPEHTFDILFGIGRASIIPALKKFKAIPMAFYRPVVNASVINDAQQAKPVYHINKVKYRYSVFEGKAILAVPHFVDEKCKIYYQINGQGRCYELQFADISQEARNSVSNWEIDTILPPSDVNFSKHGYQEGTLYFYSDKSGQTPYQIGFEYLSPLISENEPGLYHASICRHYLEECRLRRLGNANIYHFFRIHNRSSEYLNYYLSQPLKWRQAHGPVYPNVCSVVTSNASGIILFSPILAKMVLLPGQDTITVNLKDYGKEGRIYTENTDESFQLQDLAVCEQNHSISHLRLTESLRLRMFGFHKGVVSTKFKEGAGFITAETILDTEGKKTSFFFLNTPQTAPLLLGDVVTFMPSIHLGQHHNGEPMASAVMRIGTRRGTAEITENNIQADKNGNMVRVITGIDIEKGYHITSKTVLKTEESGSRRLRFADITAGTKVIYVKKDDRTDVHNLRVSIISIIRKEE